jgi:hypothetical protein
MNLFKNKHTVFIFITLLVLTYVVLKALSAGVDINVYLFASRQLFKGENIYAGNPFNQYLYSPLFALLLWPISIFDYPVARVIWAIINVVLAVRLWKIAHSLLIKIIGSDRKLRLYWTAGVAFISIGFLNHNLMLGQITIVVLWMTFEGLYQILLKNKPFAGAALLALGITIKIIPILGLFYLFFKGKFKATALCTAFVIAGLFLPAAVIGYSHNTKMLHNWASTINPSGNKYVFEDDNGTHSLNAILPAYFYDFNNNAEAPANLKRRILTVPHDSLVNIMQTLRMLLILSGLLLIFYRYKHRENKSLYFFWEFSYLALITLLIFPHQQKYALLYFVPAGSYIILFILLTIKLRWNVSLKYKIVSILASLLLFISAIMGRDIVGSNLVNIFDYYHVFGLINLVFLGLLHLVKPTHLIDMKSKTTA